MKIKQRSQVIETVSYSLCYDLYGRHSGFAFDCDASGKVDEDKLPEAAKSSLAQCRAGTVKPYVEKREKSYRQPSIGECQCGREVYLDRFTNSCDCGRDYNSAGQQLADRSQWGEETGETASDILMGGDADY
jgi:hypothetical protein